LFPKELRLRRLRDKYDAGKEEFAKLDREMREERAANISLQQVAVLRSAQQAATTRRWRIVGVMTGFGYTALFAGVPVMFQHMYSLGYESMRERFWGVPAAVCVVGYALAALAALPTDDAMIRVCSAIALMIQFGNAVGFGLYTLLDFTGVHRPKYDAPVVGTIMAWLVLSYALVCIVSIPIIFSIIRVRRGAKTASLSEVKQGAVSTLGHIGGITALLLFFPAVWAAAQPSSSFRLSTPAAYIRFWMNARVVFTAWGVCSLVASCACTLARVPWDTHPVVPSVIVHTTTLLFLAAIGLSTPVRKCVHAWLGRIGTTTEVQAAAGVAALVGTLRPAKALALAKERFCALPFDSLQPTDLATNEDSGLNQKSVPMKLGQCDAFISHVRVATPCLPRALRRLTALACATPCLQSWSDPGNLKYAVLNKWAVKFRLLWGHSPNVWLE
jgi:hypothetical protein